MVGPILGHGGMGDVHEAWDVVLCRTVALKVLKAIEPAALIRFMHEAQIHARVVHPNICRIYDVDNYEGSLRVAMQLVHGSNLEQACGELSVHEVVSIMALPEFLRALSGIARPQCVSEGGRVAELATEC